MKQIASAKQFIAIVAFATAILGNPIIRVGEQKLSKNDFVSLMEELKQGPEETVEWLREEEAAKQILGDGAETRGYARNALYSSLCGISYDEDEAKSRLRDIPLANRKLASLRIALLKRLLVQTADQKVPVVYHDLDAFWELVEATPEYRARKQAGLSPSSESMAYTWAELEVSPEALLASKDSLPLVTGELFNEYCIRFAQEMQGTNSRRENIKEVRKKIVQGIVEAILAKEHANKNGWSLNERETAMAMSTYAQRNMFTPGLNLRDLKVGATYREVTENLRTQFTQTHKDELQKIATSDAKIRRSERTGILTFLYTTPLYKEKVLREIGSELEQDNVYDWMQANRFPGEMSLARREMAKQKWTETVSQLMSQQNVTIASDM